MTIPIVIAAHAPQMLHYPDQDGLMVKDQEQASPQPRSWVARIRGVLHGPVLVGVIAAVIAIALSVFGMVRNPEVTPVTLRSLLLVIVLAGGSWGLIAWAIATAAVEAGKD